MRHAITSRSGSGRDPGGGDAPGDSPGSGAAGDQASGCAAGSSSAGGTLALLAVARARRRRLR